MFNRFSIFSKFLILASTLFAVLAALLILSSNSIIRNSFINRSKFAVSRAIQSEAKDLRAEDFSLTDPAHAREVFTGFYENVKTADIIRIKVWDYSSKVIFSDDESIVGQRFPDNDEFKEALKGEVVTEIGQKVKAENRSEQGYEQLLEVYVPIVFRGEEVPSGVIEAYFKLDTVNSQIRETQIILLVTIIAYILVSFGLLFIIFKKVVYKQIERINLQAAALDNASDHIIITDLDGIILYVNKAAEKLTGYTNKEMLGKRPSLWVHQKEQAFYEKMWNKIKVDKKEVEGHITNTRKNGEEYESAVKIAPVFDTDANVRFFVAIERDITKEKVIDKAKTEFVSMASHQLRTPISTINWYTEMLLSADAGKLNEMQTAYVKEAYKAGRRMNNLINVLLNLSGIKLGTFVIERKAVDVVALGKIVIADFEPEIQDKKIKVEFECTPQQITINTDPSLLKIVIENLLSNAVNFTPDNGKIILTVLKRENDTLISVKDTGIGIPEKMQPKVFTRLFRADNVGEASGSGLGLYSVKTIIDNLGGKIWFESKEGNGTTFSVTVPQN